MNKKKSTMAVIFAAVFVLVSCASVVEAAKDVLNKNTNGSEENKQEKKQENPNENNENTKKKKKG
jgi:hypothetical protein